MYGIIIGEYYEHYYYSSSDSSDTEQQLGASSALDSLEISHY